MGRSQFLHPLRGLSSTFQVSGTRCQVSEKNIEAETRTLDTEICIRAETLALLISYLKPEFLQYFSSPERLATHTYQECMQPQSTI